MWQLLENDCELRTLSPVKYSHISEQEIKQVIRASHAAGHNSIAIAEMLYGNLQFNILPVENNLAIVTSLATAVGQCYDATSVINAKRALFLMSIMTMKI